MMNMGFEGKLCKEVFGRSNIYIIFNEVVSTIKRYVDFYLEDIEFTYLKVYGSKEDPYKLPHYASDQLILMEFSKYFLKYMIRYG